MNKKIVIQKTIDYVKETLSDAEGGHDWWHIYRVWKTAKHIAENEKVDLFVVELGALLHDIADSKFHDGDETIGPRKTREFLTSLNLEEKIISHVENIVDNVSFKGRKHIQKFKSLELDVVQDADRLDSMGAMGITRTFNYGGYVGRRIYDPEIKPDLDMTRDQYKTNNSSSINHFYEKLLLLKDRINTKTGKSLAKKRHSYMKQFLKEFYAEWEGKE